VVHDTTSFDFGGEEGQRRGLGRVRVRAERGFFAHVSLVVGEGDERAPLGVLAARTYVHRGEPKPKDKRRSKVGGNPEAASRRWEEQALESHRRLWPGTQPVHLMDREADSYAVMAELDQAGADFVIRACHNRVAALPSELLPGAATKLADLLASAPVLLTREVALSARKKSPLPRERQIHPPRKGRIAKLAISARRVVLRRTDYVSKELPASLPINVVRVLEVDAPAGTTPVEWVLLTRLPIDTPEQLAVIVDHYRARWVIEEFFKALKTGCIYEQRQLMDLHNLLNALATFIPVAWRLLLLRHTARHAPDAPASEALNATQLQVLAASPRARLPLQPTVRAALLAVARLGGHLAQNGDPGWQVLGRGFHDLLLMEEAWSAARRGM
jgi:hypothetical protein